MIKLENYSLSFKNKTVFDNASFVAYTGQLTLITGESGSGKTTLLNSLSFNNKFSGQYVYNDCEMTNKTDFEKENYIANEVYIIEQFPSFLNDITIEQHFKVFGNNYQQYDDLKCINKLGIEKLMKEHPKQLSDGEKKRVSLCLAFMMNKHILLVDEPTASLDDEYGCIVSQLLKEYARKGRCVVISSHDSHMKEYADTVYHIQYQRLTKTVDSQDCCNSDIEKRNTNFDYKLYLSMFAYYVKSKFTYFLILVLLISLVGMSSEFNNTAVSYHNMYINELSSKEIKIYKSMGDNAGLKYSEDGSEFPFTSKEVEYINSLDHIQQIDWRYDYNILRTVDESIDLTFEKEEGLIDKVVVFNENKTLFKKMQDIDVLKSIFVKTYTNNIDYTNKVESLFDEDGVYISRELAKKITENNEELKGKSIQIPLLIPVYNISGMGTYVTETGKEYELNCVGSLSSTITLPIAGVLEATSLYDTETNSSNIYQIFIPQKHIEKAIKDIEKPEEKVIYVVEENNKREGYTNHLPDDKKDKVVQIIKGTPWEPNCYILTITDLEYLDSVLQKINEAGLNASSIYIDSNSLKESVERMKRSVQMVGGGISIMLIIIAYQVKKNNKQAEKEGNQYLENMGKTKKEVKKIKQRKYLVFFFIEVIICIGTSFCIIQFLNLMMYGNTNFSLLICGIIIMITFIIEYIYPKLIERKE